MSKKNTKVVNENAPRWTNKNCRTLRTKTKREKQICADRCYKNRDWQD